MSVDTQDPDDLNGKRLWTLEDVALYLSRTVPAVRRMRDFGLLPQPRKVGKKLYWDSAEFRRWREERPDEPEAQ